MLRACTSSSTRVLLACLSAACCLACAAAGLASERNAYRVRSAFREAVAGPARSTVEVRCGGQRVALGVIVDADGTVFTKASELRGDAVCHLPDGRVLPARKIADVEQHDLAVLKLDAEDLPAVEWRGSEPLKVGSWLAAAGQGTLPIAVGVVSAAVREIERRLPALGIVLEDGERGPRVHQVVSGSGADKAGVLSGDVVAGLNGKPYKLREQLIEAIRGFRPGDTVRLSVQRGDKSLELEATLGDLADLNESQNPFPEDIGGRLSKRREGFPQVFEHDLVLKPEDCGGPLVDLDGKVAGLSIARASRVSSYAIPASVLRQVVDEFKSGRLVSAHPAE